jgi:hypothetical protein
MQYSDLVAGQTANPPVYDQQGMQTATAQTGNGYQPLPQLNPQTGGATYAGAQTQDPIAIFNQNLYQMLQDRQKQSAGQNAPLMAQSNQLQNQNISNAMSQPNLPMRPGDALNARQDAGNIYNPAITNLTDRMTLNNQAITDFKSAIDAATTFGEKYAAQIKPDDATIKAVTEQMQAGFIPDQTVLDKVAKYLPNDIWAQAAAAKKAQSASGTDTTKFKFASGDVGQLLAAGFTQPDIAKIQSDIGTYGIDKVTEGMSDSQKKAVQQVVGGATYAQQQTADKTNTQFLTADFFKQQYGSGLQAAAQTAGFTKKSGGLFDMGIGAKDYGDTDAYVNNLMTRVDQYRKAGYSDQDILKMMQ